MIGRLHVLTDAVLQDRFDPITLGRLALQGGADVVQYREKRPIDDRERLRVAEALAGLCADHGATLIIDDRADIAALVGAGVHLGPSDVPPQAARRLVSGLVGATANHLGMARDLDLDAVDYLGCGPVFGTTSKGPTPPPALGVDGLSGLCRAIDRPIIAIDSLRVDRVESVIEAGAHGIAVLGAVCLADDPTAATARLREALDAAMAAR